MSLNYVKKLKRKLEREFENQTGLTSRHRDEWKKWLEANGHIEPEERVSEESIKKVEAEYLRRLDEAREIYFNDLKSLFGQKVFERVCSSLN